MVITQKGNIEGKKERKCFIFHCKMSYLKTKYPAKNSDGGSGHSAIGGFYYDLFGKGKTSDFITDLFIVLFTSLMLWLVLLPPEGRETTNFFCSCF